MPKAKSTRRSSHAKARKAASSRSHKSDSSSHSKTNRRAAAGRFVPLSELSPYGHDDLVNVVIETSKGSANKLGYEPELGTFKLHSVLPEGSTFPFDFGFIPGTLADDGDPLDVLLLMDYSLVPGTVVCARLVGVIEGMQTEKDGTSEENDRLIAVCPQSPLYVNIKKLSELPKELVEQVQNFFVDYNKQMGKVFKPEGQHGPKRATACFERARKQYRRKRGK